MVLSTPLLLAGGKQNDLDRGENPVVGSLPCMVDDTLDLIFWEGNGSENPDLQPAIYPVTLGMCATDIRQSVLDADGLPYGRLNHRHQWRTLGLQNSGWALFDADSFASGEVTTWFWAPQAYLGGELVMSTPFGSGTVTITPAARELPLSDIVNLSGNSVSVSSFEVRPPAWSSAPVIQARVTSIGTVVKIEYL